MNLKKTAVVIVALVCAFGAGLMVWKYSLEPGSLEGFASGNGRIEAEEVDIATKLPGRVSEILAEEGDLVEAGQVLARMDTKSLEAQLLGAEAQVNQAVKAREYAAAMVVKSESDCQLAEKKLARSRTLFSDARGAISAEQLDTDVAAARSAQAACTAAEAQLANADAAIKAAEAEVQRINADLDDSILKAPRRGRILYRLTEPGEVLAAGGKVLTVLDLTDVYMTLYLPTSQVGQVDIGTEARILLDALPDVAIPARVTFISPEAQFTPREVETRTEREKLMFRVKVKIDPALLERHIEKVKTGLPGVAYVRLDDSAEWPQHLQPPPDL